jgi:hypothetical protein
MGRELSDMDRDILVKLVPEFEVLVKKGIDLDYMNILPPVANHHSKDEKDFENRLNRLSSQDMQYISEQILNGNESLCCLYPEFAEVFFTVAGKKLSSEVADKLREAYESGDSVCG